VVVLGQVRRDKRKHRVWLDIPLCQKRYGDSRGAVEAELRDNLSCEDGISIGLVAYCRAKEPPEGLELLFELTGTPPEDRVLDYVGSGLHACVKGTGEVTTEMWQLEHLHEFLYGELGTGARPLLELAKRAEEAGDKDMAGILKKLYAVMEASGDVIEEIKQGYRAEVPEEAVERAVELLRRAKEAARKGDLERLNRLLDTPVIESGWARITLYDIITEGYPVREVYEGRDYLERADIYDAIITAAEHFGLEVRRP